MTAVSIPSPVRTLSELDHARIARLLGTGAPHTDMQALLDNADLVAPGQIAPDVITMRSRLRVSELTGDASRELTLAYPGEADPANGQLSVLSPAGTALLGLKAGEVARWTQPDGRMAALRVDALLYQPEANGDHLR